MSNFVEKPLERTIENGEELTISYFGKPKPIAKIQLFNLLMLIPTLGVYRFWAITRLRRYFWSSISFNGTKLEYTGRGKELFMGLIVVLLVLVPLGLIISLISNYLLLYSENLFTIFNLIVVLIFTYLSYAAIFLRRRYLLSRTKWRGIRMALTGSPWAFGKFGLKQFFLQLITLGLYSPYASMNVHQKLWSNSFLGDQPIRSKRIMRGLMKVYVPLWILYWVGLSAIFTFAISGFLAASLMVAGADLFHLLNWESFLDLALVVVCLWLAVIFWLTMIFEARKLRNLIDGLTLQSLKFQSNFKGLNLVKTYLLIIILLAIVAVITYFSILLASSNSSIVYPERSTHASMMVLSFMQPILISALVTYIASLFLIPVIVTHRVFRDLVATTATGGTFDPSLIGQSEEEVSTRGEGLANALDVGGF